MAVVRKKETYIVGNREIIINIKKTLIHRGKTFQVFDST
jgi:hypothetical protein